MVKYTIVLPLLAMVAMAATTGIDIEALKLEIFGTPPPRTTTEELDYMEALKREIFGTPPPRTTTDKLDYIEALKLEIFGTPPPRTTTEKLDYMEALKREIFGTPPPRTTTDKLDYIEALKLEIFGTPPPRTTTEKLDYMEALKREIFGTPPPRTTTDKQKPPVLCSTPSGGSGWCALPAQCKKAVRNPITLGSKRNNIAGYDVQCPMYTQVCCPYMEQPTDTYASRYPHKKEYPDLDYKENEDPKSKSTCGVRGEEDGETPWLVIIKDSSKIWQSSNVYEGSVGGGTIIHPSVVLTAAHIVYARNELQVVAGRVDTQTRDVDSMKVHEHFNRLNAHNDIALLFLTEPLTLSPGVRLACLPRAGDIAPARCMSTEWAKSPHTGDGSFKTMVVPVLKHQQCQDKYRNTRLGRYFILDKSFLCAAGERRREVCTGDGGFPLTCPVENGDRFAVFGAVLWDIECGLGAPTVHAHVAALRDWVDRHVEQRSLSTNNGDRFAVFGAVLWDIECGLGAPTGHAHVAALRDWVDRHVAQRILSTDV